MKKYIFKIGQEIKIQGDMIVKSYLKRTILKVNKGDLGVINSRKSVRLLTGEAIGKIIKIDNIELKGFDYNNISKIILNNLLTNTGIGETMEDYCISDDEISEVIEDTLREII